MSKKENVQKISQVAFLEVSESYMLGEDIKVSYLLSGSWKPSSSDWVGLFNVEKEDPNQYVTYVYSQPPVTFLDNDSVTLCVTFKACYLPRDSPSTDLFRFCYVTKQGNIRGRSTPFHFAKDESSSPREEDATSDIVIVEEGFGDLEKLQRKLDEVKMENFSLQKRLKESEEQSHNLNNLLSAAEEEIQTLWASFKKQEDSNQETVNDKDSKIAALEQRLHQIETLTDQMKVEEGNAAASKNQILTRLNEVETERDCIKAELAHLQEATATSRFREAELRKAIEAAHDTTRALIQENNERRIEEDQLLSAKCEIERLTEKIYRLEKELEVKSRVSEPTTECIQPASRKQCDAPNRDRYSSQEKETKRHGSDLILEKHTPEKYIQKSVESSSTSLDNGYSNDDIAKDKRFFPNVLDRLVKNILK